MAHIEMLATAVALNLETAPNDTKDKMAADSPIMGGANLRQVKNHAYGHIHHLRNRSICFITQLLLMVCDGLWVGTFIDSPRNP